MKKIITYFKQLRCKHNFQEVIDVELEKWKQESMRELLNKKIDSFTETTTIKCDKCGVERYYVTTNI